MAENDTSFVLKNLTLYKEEQYRRLTGNFIDIEKTHLSKKHNPIILPSDSDKQQYTDESNPELDLFFQDSDLSFMTSESQSLLDDMFSS